MNQSTISQPQAEKLRAEMRRGVLVLAVLGQLRSEHYAYSLRQELASKGLHIEEGTLYPLIRRLEKQGLLTSQWRDENSRRKRFYQLSEDGFATYAEMYAEWRALHTSLTELLPDLSDTSSKLQEPE